MTLLTVVNEGLVRHSIVESAGDMKGFTQEAGEYLCIIFVRLGALDWAVQARNDLEGLKSCIQRYTSRKSDPFLKKIANLVFRFLNLLPACLGLSLWQSTEAEFAKFTGWEEKRVGAMMEVILHANSQVYQRERKESHPYTVKKAKGHNLLKIAKKLDKGAKAYLLLS